MGITTYVAARFFAQTITRPGTMTVQVAHDQESAEEIFKIVHRFGENLPEPMKRGALLRSGANVRQMVFPGSIVNIEWPPLLMSIPAAG